MTVTLNRTHDPSLRSWIGTANRPDHDFPIQNLPFGVFVPRGTVTHPPRVGVAIGDSVLDVAACAVLAEFEGEAAAAAAACASPSLNRLMALPPSHWSALRAAVSDVLREGYAGQARVASSLVPVDDVELRVPVDVGDYTDFYASLHHAMNVGRMFRPDRPLLPNYKHMPIGYHGRASSIVPSGTAVRRPIGQIRSDDTDMPVVEPTKRLDYELEVGFFIGGGNALGTPVPMRDAPAYLFGACLLNDWSARDVQTWEYQPLGPFLAKNFCSSISPWVVTFEALAPYRCSPMDRSADDPPRLAYLDDPPDRRVSRAIDVTVEVWLSTARMRAEHVDAVRVSAASLRELYWTPEQFVVHHTMNGCNLRSGDLFGSGTISGAHRESRGCLLELTWRGDEPVELAATRERRTFLEDGDEVILRGWCARDGWRRIGFGECRGQVLPAVGTR